MGNLVSLAAFPVAGALAYRFGVKAMLLDKAFTRKFVLGVLASLLLFNFALGSFRIFVFAGLRSS